MAPNDREVAYGLTEQYIELLEAVVERTWFATDSWDISYCCREDLYDGHAESCPVEKLFKFREEHGYGEGFIPRRS